MEDLNLASIQSYKIEVNYTKNKVLNYINFVGENGAAARACGKTFTLPYSIPEMTEKPEILDYFGRKS